MEEYEGQMPCLVDSGEAYTESSNIVEYIEYYYPEPTLSLKDEPQKVEKVTCWHKPCCVSNFDIFVSLFCFECMYMKVELYEVYCFTPLKSMHLPYLYCVFDRQLLCVVLSSVSCDGPILAPQHLST